MTRSLVIPPEGLPTGSEEEPDVLARTLLQTASLDVVIARALGRERLYVMYIDDWGMTKELPINRRAWALYGASPIYGLAVLCADDQGLIEDELVELVSEPGFPPENIQRVMDKWLEAHR